MPNTPEPKLTVGSKAQVFHGTAKKTAGGLKKGDLMKHNGRIVSKKQHAAGLQAIKRLRAKGFVAKKGEFKLFGKANAKKSPKAKTVKAKSVKRTVAKTRAMSKANHNKRHSAALKAWNTRRSKPSVGGFW